MSKLSKLAAVTIYCAVLGGAALGSLGAPLCCAPANSRQADPRPAVASAAAPASDTGRVRGGQGWFVLDTGLGSESLPILYRLDRGELLELVPLP